MFSDAKNSANVMDLKEYEGSYKKAKKALEKNSSTDYYVCYCEKRNWHNKNRYLRPQSKMAVFCLY